MLLVDNDHIKIDGTGLEIVEDLAILTHDIYEVISKKYPREKAAELITGAVALGFTPEECLEKAINDFVNNFLIKSKK